jgi:hypothetical protein
MKNIKSISKKMYVQASLFSLLVANLNGNACAFQPISAGYSDIAKAPESWSSQHFDRATMMAPLRMSTLDPEETDFAKIVSKLTSKLPPPPEDQISMAGDIACLFLYTFIDHFVNSLYDLYLNSPDTVDKLSARAAIESASAASSEISTTLLGNDSITKSLPVWFDTMSAAPFGNVPLTSALPLEHHIAYSPAMATGGMASVLLCSAWLVSGYFTGAFRFKNTFTASPNKAILVTGKTWVLSSLIMLGIAYGSNSLIGCVDCLHPSVGITKADTDFIFDSLSVLLIWRFILSSFFGSED